MMLIWSIGHHNQLSWCVAVASLQPAASASVWASASASALAIEHKDNNFMNAHWQDKIEETHKDSEQNEEEDGDEGTRNETMNDFPAACLNTKLCSCTVPIMEQPKVMWGN